MRKYIDLVESNIVPYDHDQVRQGEVAGPHRENMTVQEAKAYLDNYPEGVLCHDVIESEAFVAVTKYGVYVFYNPNTNRVEHWDWTKDIADLVKYSENDGYDVMNGWWYNAGDEQLGYSRGGLEFWDRIRNGLEIPVETGT